MSAPPAAGADALRLSEALLFAAEAHANQRRKGAAQEPYLNHLIEVMDLVARHTGGEDVELMIAALLHDVVEDTPASSDELAGRFGKRVARIVEQTSDDMSLPKDERRRRRIESMAAKPADARIVKIADVISNLRAIAVSPPAGWTAERRLSYLDGCRRLVDAGRGANASLEAEFDQAAADSEARAREDAAFEAEGRAAATRSLESAVGQPVHLVYLANTEAVPIGDAEVAKVAEAISRSFPSATIQRAEGLYEGGLRPILICRIRTDSTDAVVALAQRLCIVFDQRFVGVEVDGRYIRIYADDTA